MQTISRYSRSSFNLRRSTLSLAVAAALSITAQGAFAQSLVVNSSTSSVDLGGASGASFGPDTTTVIGNVTNSGTDQATGSANGVDNAATVNNWDNPTGSAIIAGSGGAGVMNTGNIVSMTNEGTIKGSIGIDNKNTLQSLINAVGGSIGDGMTGLYGIYNEAGGTIGLLKDNGGLIVGLSTGVAYVNNAGHIVTLDEEGNETSSSASMQAAFINQATGRIDQFTIGTNARITLFGTAAGLINLGAVTQVTIGGVLNASGDAFVNGSATNSSSTVGGVTVSGLLESATGSGGGNGIHNYGLMGDVTETSTGLINGSLPGTAAINNEAGAVIAAITLDGRSDTQGYVIWNKGTTGNVEIGGQVSASGDAVIENTNGASMGTFTTDQGSTVQTLGTTNTNAAVQNDGTMAGMALNGSVSSLNGVGVVNTSTGTITNGITVGMGGSVSGKSGIENDGNLPTLDVLAGGSVSGTAIAGVELNSGTTTATVSGIISGSGAADAMQVTNPGTTANVTVENNGSLVAFGTGNGLTVGGGATANVTVQDNANIEAATTGSAVDVKNAGTLNLTLNGRNAQVQNLGGTTGSTIVGEQGSNLNVTATGYSAGGAGPDITATGTAPTIDIAGTAALNLDALVSNTSNGTALQIESTGNLTSFTNKGVIEGAVKNLSSNPLVINGASSYTDGTSTNGELGLFTGTSTNQSEIDSVSDVTLASGYTVLNDAVNAPNLNVANGATLVSYAPVAINGNFNVATGASLVSQVLGSTSYGQWNVTGNTTFAGMTTLKLAAYNTFGFADGQRYTVVTTTGTASYNLAGISTSVVGYSGHVTTSQVGNNLVVTLGAASSGGTSTPTDPSSPSAPSAPSNPTTPSSPSAPSSPVAASSVSGLTQTSVAATNGVVRYTGWNSAGLMNAENVVLAIEQNGTARQVTQAGTQLAPLPHAQAGNAMLAIGDAAQGVVADRAEAQRVAKQAGVATPSGVTTWGRAFGGAEQRGATAGGTYGEVSGSNLTFGGLAIGVDKAVTPTWTVGGAFSYANGQSNATGDASGQHLSDNAFGLTFYQNWTPTSGRLYVDVSENASLHRFNESRSIDLAGVNAGSASGRFNGTSFGARVEAGLPIALRNGIDVTPYVALGVQHLSLGGYTESDGGSGVGLNVNGASYTSVRTTVGVKVSKSFETKAGTVDVYLKPAFVHEFAGSPSNTTAVFNGDATGETSFTTVSASPVRNIASVTLGATLYRAKGLSLNAQVNVQAGSHYTGVAGGVQAKWSF